MNVTTASLTKPWLQSPRHDSQVTTLPNTFSRNSHLISSPLYSGNKLSTHVTSTEKVSRELDEKNNFSQTVKAIAPNRIRIKEKNPCLLRI
jgi:hypothetical protein